MKVNQVIPRQTRHPRQRCQAGWTHHPRRLRHPPPVHQEGGGDTTAVAVIEVTGGVAVSPDAQGGNRDESPER